VRLNPARVSDRSFLGPVLYKHLWGKLLSDIKELDMLTSATLKSDML
jgi:hypothetical protein